MKINNAVEKTLVPCVENQTLCDCCDIDIIKNACTRQLLSNKAGWAQSAAPPGFYWNKEISIQVVINSVLYLMRPILVFGHQHEPVCCGGGVATW